MTNHQINRHCMECFHVGEPFYCDVRRLLQQLYIPPQEQIILMSMASEKKMYCEDFKNMLLFIRQSGRILYTKQNLTGIDFDAVRETLSAEYIGEDFTVINDISRVRRRKNIGKIKQK